MTQSKVIFWFTNSAGILLTAAGVAMFVGTGANAGFLPPHDPLFEISMPAVFWIVGAIGLGVGMVCLFGKQAWVKLSLVLWFALNFCAYLLGLFWTAGPHSFDGYWCGLADSFGISPLTLNLILEMACLYLLAGSSALLAWSRLRQITDQKAGYLKIPCPSCGGKIKFPPANIGQQIACPHCQSAVILRKPDEKLKMTCVLCGGHVEFPAHAIGQKIQCPHCAKTITLLQPA